MTFELYPKAKEMIQIKCHVMSCFLGKIRKNIFKLCLLIHLIFTLRKSVFGAYADNLDQPACP